jgi:nicotinic acid mononucleotide adenylyltransferase
MNPGPLRLVLFFIFSVFIKVHAVDIKSVHLLPTDRVATYIGTFNPPHFRHQDIVEGVLNSGKIDYVVVLANDLNFHKPEATDYSHRQHMLWLLYQNHPKVLVIKNIDDFKFPVISKVTEYLEEKCFKLYGIMGWDSLNSFKTRLAAHFIKRDAWIVTHAENLSEDELKINEVAGKPVEYIHIPLKNEDVRSSSLRTQLTKGQYDNLPLSPELIAYIQRENLFKNPPKKPSLFKRISFCSQQLFKILKD